VALRCGSGTSQWAAVIPVVRRCRWESHEPYRRIGSPTEVLGPGMYGAINWLLSEEDRMIAKIRNSLVMFFVLTFIFANTNHIFLSQIEKSSSLKTIYIILLNVALGYLLVTLMQISEALKDINQRLEKIEKEPKQSL